MEPLDDRVAEPTAAVDRSFVARSICANHADGGAGGLPINGSASASPRNRRLSDGTNGTDAGRDGVSLTPIFYGLRVRLSEGNGDDVGYRVDA